MHPVTKYRIHIACVAVAIMIGAVVFLWPEGVEQLKPGKVKGLLFPSNKELVEHQFAPHKALYEIELASTRSGSQIINISGQMFYEWKPTCDAWLSDHRFNMHYEYADAPGMRMVSNFSTYEGYDGKRFDFTSQRKTNGEVFEEIRGSVAGKQAMYRLPVEQIVELPEGTLYPIAHTAEVARRIKTGEKFYNAVLFDGSDLEGAIEVNTFIGDGTEPPASLMKKDSVDAALLKSPAYQVRLAFFPLTEDQVTADYEMDIIFHENGVISDMVVEYDDFSVTQKLIALEKIEGTCEESP